MGWTWLWVAMGWDGCVSRWMGVGGQSKREGGEAELSSSGTKGGDVIAIATTATPYRLLGTQKIEDPFADDLC